MEWDFDEAAARVLTTYKSFAVVGCSSKPHRPSYGVARFLQAKGYDVTCINPNYDECFGDSCYPSLKDIPEGKTIEVVDIFRRSEAAGVHVDEAIEIGAKAVWMQLGVIDESAALRARDAGLEVVMDRCPAIEHPKIFGR